MHFSWEVAVEKKIFIGSALEHQDSLAKPIAQELASAGFSPARWWRLFEFGDVPLEKLRETADECVGAVLICVGADSTWYRNQEYRQPRDNLLIELGLFLQALGRRRVVIVTDAGVKIPSDLAGLTYLVREADTASMCEKIVDHFKQVFTEVRPQLRHTPEIIRMEVDPQVANSLSRRPVPEGWHQRALYLGPEGAIAWLDLINDPEFTNATEKERTRHQILTALADLNVASFVSLGPGDGKLDYDISVALPRLSRPLIYIPVDINENFLYMSAARLSGHTYIPAAILSDFEDRLPCIADQVNRRKESPTLFALVANTLGNLDRYEQSFMTQMAQWMESGDYFLLEVFISELSSEEGEKTLPPPSVHGQTRQVFYSRGLARQLSIPWRSVYEEYEERILVKPGYSAVPGAHSVDVIDSITGTHIQSSRRYNLRQLMSWLADSFGFSIVTHQEFLREETNLGWAVIVARKDTALGPK